VDERVDGAALQKQEREKQGSLPRQNCVCGDVRKAAKQDNAQRRAAVRGKRFQEREKKIVDPAAFAFQFDKV